MKAIIESLRPTQWIKNLSLFAAVILNGQLFNKIAFRESFIAFWVFCFLSSSSYLVNDLLDLKKDRFHPLKKTRPIARGDLDPSIAVLVAFILLASGLVLSFSISIPFFIIALIFISLQYLYSFALKKKAIIDIFGIALFFIIRAFAGEIASGYHLPVWIMLTVIFLALFIASGKRRSELVKTGSAATRSSLAGYGKTLLNFYATMFGVCTLLCYALFTFFDQTISFNGPFHEYFLTYFPGLIDRKWYMITLLPVIFGIMRYGQIIFEMQEGERPERVIATDIPLILSVLTWGVSIIILIYVL